MTIRQVVRWNQKGKARQLICCSRRCLTMKLGTHTPNVENSREKAFIPDTDLPEESAMLCFDLTQTALGALQMTKLQTYDSICLATKLKLMLMKGEVICSSKSHSAHIVKCRNDMVVKCFEPELAADGPDWTEYTCLEYLARHLPEIPFPTPHGLLRSGRMAYILMDYMPGQTLEEVWPLLTKRQKSRLQHELDEIFTKLRGLPKPSGMGLGGVNGEGCKDTRRHTRRAEKPIQSATDFWKFVYESPMGPTTTYIQTVRSWFITETSEKCVFTHGDLRPANIHVLLENNGRYCITGILDWERGGFYPEAWESCKITNCLTPLDTSDWYLHLPDCVSPARNTYTWLLDHFWDRYLLGQADTTKGD